MTHINPDHRLRLRVATGTLLKIIRKARRDAWDDAIDDAFHRGWLHEDARKEMHARNPNRDAWSNHNLEGGQP